MTEGGTVARSPRVRRLLQILSATLLASAALVLVTGGIQWRIGGALLRSRDPGRVLLLFDVLVLLLALLYPREFANDTVRWRPCIGADEEADGGGQATSRPKP